jgi:hypothetical protein
MVPWECLRAQRGINEGTLATWPRIYSLGGSTDESHCRPSDAGASDFSAPTFFDWTKNMVISIIHGHHWFSHKGKSVIPHDKTMQIAIWENNPIFKQPVFLVWIGLSWTQPQSIAAFFRSFQSTSMWTKVAYRVWKMPSEPIASVSSLMTRGAVPKRWFIQLHGPLGVGITWPREILVT